MSDDFSRLQSDQERILYLQDLIDVLSRAVWAASDVLNPDYGLIKKPRKSDEDHMNFVRQCLDEALNYEKRYCDYCGNPATGFRGSKTKGWIDTCEQHWLRQDEEMWP